MESYYVTEACGTGEIEEKKSRFIAHVVPIDSETGAVSAIGEIKKKYWDARHNCFAYVLGENNEIQRFSDDGEPQGTAGKPILETLVMGNIHNTLVVVTRYFGGTLLGTGGLIRAYGRAAKEGIANAVVKKVSPGIGISLTVDYNHIGKVKYVIGQMGIRTEEEQYGENVNVTVSMKESDYEKFVEKITDETNGKVVPGEGTKIEYREDI